MFSQQKVVINFSAGYFSSTDSFGESTEANSRNAHNFSNSQICVLPITLFREHWVISERLSDLSARQTAQLLQMSLRRRRPVCLYQSAGRSRSLLRSSPNPAGAPEIPLAPGEARFRVLKSHGLRQNLFPEEL